MKKRVIILHGWEGSPENSWFPWLKNELLARKFIVVVPQLPDSGNPLIQKWIPAVAKAVGIPDEQTYFVGHSLGCQAIARYVESLPKEVQFGGAVFVAGFFKRLTGIENETRAKRTERHWIDTPVDLKKVSAHFTKSIAIFSDNDPYVPLDNQIDFLEKLGSEIIIEERKGHFTGDDGILEVPAVLASLLKLAH